jgi:hypothetical protein
VQVKVSQGPEDDNMLSPLYLFCAGPGATRKNICETIPSSVFP